MNHNEVRRDLATDVPTSISWGAIIAGWVVSLGVAWLLYQLGGAIGLTMIDPAEDPSAIDKGFSIGAGIWFLLTWLISLFIGGWFAGRSAGRTWRGSGMLHGTAVWGLSTVVTLIIIILGASNIVQGGIPLLSAGAKIGAGAAGGGNLGLEAQIKQAISDAVSENTQGDVPPQQINQALNQIKPEDLTAIAARMLRGDTEGTKNLIDINTNLNRQQIDSVVNSLQAQVPRFKAEIEQAAQKAAEYSATLLWITFISTLLTLIAAILGGSMGVRASMPRTRHITNAPDNT